MSEIQNPLSEKQKSNVFKKAVKTKGYLELCEKNLMSADDKISMESPEHAIIRNALSDIREAASSIELLIRRTEP